MSVCTRRDGQVFVNYREGGKLQRKYFGKGQAALDKAKAFNSSRAKPLYIASPLFVELCSAYLAGKASTMARSTSSNLIVKLDAVIVPALGDLPALGIDADVLDKYVANRLRAVKATTVHHELSYIRAILRFAVKRGLLPRNPMAGYEFLKRDDATILPMSHAEIEAVLKHSPEHLRRAILLSFFLGLRPGASELLSLKYNQVNWTAMSITVISARKGGVMRREVPIHPALPLRKWFEADGSNQDRHIITWQGKPVARIRMSFEHAKSLAGVGGRKIPLYSLRHAFVSTLLHQGVDLKTVADISGHDVRTMLKHYAHSMSGARTAAIMQLPALHSGGAENEGAAKK